ncbi:MAG: Gfo/Idh/MocA family oxidoreductase [Bryobacteraceae bacterium]|jgi:predicted dehydrogenase
MCRKRGRIVLVGVTGLDLSRDDFYKKELSFQVSCSYGPGRYDPAYEDKGQDYPIAFVRWTAQRNFEAVLDLLADGRLDVKPLVTHRFPFDQAEKAYALLLSDEPYLGILLEYPTEGESPSEELTQKTIRVMPSRPPTRAPVVNVIGAGGYATKTLLPAFQRTEIRFRTIASRGGLTAAHAARKFGFENASTDVEETVSDSEADVLVIATHHDSHARYVCDALRAGKHVFVEKPLALCENEMAEIESLYRSLACPPLLMVGFNRRFAPQIVKAKELLTGLRGPKALVYTVNAGAIPPEHWTQDPSVGGGRILGEACHFIDLLRHLAGSPITSIETAKLTGDTVTITLKFADASIGSVHYFANGHRSVPKERLEVFCGGRILQIDNFRRLKAYGWRGFSKMNLWRQDKGAERAISAFVNTVRSGGPAPIPFEELCEVTRATLAAAR